MKEYIKPSVYAKIKGCHYRTVMKHYHAGYIEGYKDKYTGSIFIKNFKRSTEIVVAQPCKADIATWSPIFMEIPNSSLLNTCSIKEKYKM